MVHRTMGLPHKSEPKNSYCVIWVDSRPFVKFAFGYRVTRITITRKG